MKAFIWILEFIKKFEYRYIKQVLNIVVDYYRIFQRFLIVENNLFENMTMDLVSQFLCTVNRKKTRNILETIFESHFIILYCWCIQFFMMRRSVYLSCIIIIPWNIFRNYLARISYLKVSIWIKLQCYLQDNPFHYQHLY